MISRKKELIIVDFEFKNNVKLGIYLYNLIKNNLLYLWILNLVIKL